MKKIDPEKEELLDGLLTDVEQDAAPGIDRVLAGVRRERHARATRRVLSATFASMLLLGLVVMRQPEQEFRPVVAVVPQTPVPGVAEQNAPGPSVGADQTAEVPDETTLKIERIGDQELMDMLDEMPVALVKYPDGNRRLMMVVDHSGQ